MALSKTGEIETKIVNTTVEDLYRLLCKLIKPKDQSDRTTFMRIARWVVGKCADGTFNEYEIVPRILDYARESVNPNSRNPAAVFISILKKELGYPK